MKTRKPQHPTARRLRVLLTVFLILSSLLLLSAGALFLYATHDLDLGGDAALLASFDGSRTTRLYAHGGDLLDSPISEAEYIPIELDSVCGMEDRIRCEDAEIPRILKDAFVAIEDRRFYRHDGVDWLRTARAAVNSILHFDRRFGGSTITQQLIKNVSGENRPTLRRKLREIVRAVALERRLTKDEILCYYLNVIPLGNRCYGVASASRYYFGKPPTDLTLAEAATLAAITNAPSRYDPVRFRERSRERRDLVLRKMAEYGAVTQEEADAAIREPLSLALHGENAGERIRSWYTETVITDVVRDLMRERGLSRQSAESMVYCGGLRIYTLCAPSVQKTADRCFARLGELSERGIEGALTVIDPRDGALLAVEGALGVKRVNRPQSYATDVKRPPGSALKPIALYAPALRAGLIGYGSVLDDVPHVLSDGSLWPHNTPDRYLGRITAHAALASSKNTVAVTLYEMLGAEAIANGLSRDYGIEVLRRSRGGVSDLSPAPLALGQLSEGVTLLDLTAAYSVFSGGGVYRAPRSYLRVLSEDGSVLLENAPSERRVLSEAEAFIMTEMLREVVEGGTASAVTLRSCIDTAGKTGTSGGSRDRWFVGYTPYFLGGVLLTGVGRSLEGMGVSAVSVWDDLMCRLHAPQLSGRLEPRGFSSAPGIVYASYCADSGCRPSPLCRLDPRGSRIECGPYTPDSIPREVCHVHLPLLYDPDTEQYRRPETVGAERFFMRRTVALDDRTRQIPEGIEVVDRRLDLSFLLLDAGDEKRRKNGALGE